MPFEVRDDQIHTGVIDNHYNDDGLLWQTNYAAVEVYDYPNATMNMKLFCQSYWGELHDLTFSASPKSTHKPDEEAAWPTKLRQSLAQPGTDEAAILHTPLAAVVRYDTGVPTTHLFYISTQYKIREVIWRKGSQTNECLGIDVSPVSSLAATKWGAGNNTHIRLYYQSRTGAIEEHCLDCNANTWTKGATLSSEATSYDEETPMRGTSLSFINLAQDKPDIRGYFQNAKGSVRDFHYDGYKWSIGDLNIETAPFRTPLAAITVTREKKIALYYVDSFDRINEQVWEDGNWGLGKRIDDYGVAPGARLAVASLKYIGHDKIHLFSSGLVNVISQRMWDRKGEVWGEKHTVIDFDVTLPVQVNSGLNPALHLREPTRDGRRY